LGLRARISGESNNFGGAHHNCVAEDSLSRHEHNVLRDLPEGLWEVVLKEREKAVRVALRLMVREEHHIVAGRQLILET